MKNKISPLQDPKFGGTMRRLNTGYGVSETPIGDKAKWGTLAHVPDNVREAILAAGYGEIQTHISYIEKKISQAKRDREKKERGMKMAAPLREELIAQ